MRFNLRILFEDGTSAEVTAKAADVVAFEERFDLSLAQLQDKVKMTHLLFLGWHVQHRTGETKDDFGKWLELVDNVEVVGEKK